MEIKKKYVSMSMSVLDMQPGLCLATSIPVYNENNEIEEGDEILIKGDIFDYSPFTSGKFI